MQQVWITKTGGPEVLEVREAVDPVPTAEQVRVCVEGAGVNFADILARQGLYPDAPALPAVVGYEVSGRVDAIGSNVKGLEVGQRVLAMTRFGGYSTSIVAPPIQVVPVPDNISFETAASIPVNYITAWLMLRTLGALRKGERVLIHAAAGGVGLAAIQIAKELGAEIIGTASGSKHARLKEMGVAHTIDYRTQDFEKEVMAVTNGQGVGIALDAVGGQSFRKSYRCLANPGRLFLFGVSSFSTGLRRNLFAAAKGLLQMPRFGAIDLMNNNRGVFGVNVGQLWHQGALVREILKEVIDRFADGRFASTVDTSFSFDQAGDAHRYIQERKNFGKVLLLP